MRIFKQSEFEMFKTILKCNQPTLKEAMHQFLTKYYDKIVNTAYYIYAEGTIPVAVVAHLDTVYPSSPKNIFYDKVKNVIWSPEGLGTDDRAGVYGIIKLLKMGYRPHIILTTDEEKGGLGAQMVAIDYPEAPAKFKYIIELDRQGAQDCVFYECDNPDFEEYVESFGFVTNLGTFSDISVICPNWGVAGVNLSIGYINEHSFAEHFYVSHFFATIDKVCKMFDDIQKSNSFEYIPCKYNRYWSPTEDWYSSVQVRCSECGQMLPEYEMFAIKQLDGSTGYRCVDCCIDGVEWCASCGEAFELEKGDHSILCRDCKQAIFEKGMVALQ